MYPYLYQNMCFISIFFLFNLCFLTYAFPPNLWIKNITQTSNEDSPGYVTKVAISESVQSIILEKLDQ
ncbi:Monocarboxylate transporter [Dirofilaria immitis]